MPRLSEGDRWQIVALSSRAGWNQKRLAREFGVSQPTISELLSKNRQTGEVKDKPRSGRPVCSDVNDNGLILDYVGDNIPQAKVRKLIRSMRSRIRECIRARGGPSRY